MSDPSKTVPRIIVFGHLGQGNIGDELMFRAIVIALKRRFPNGILTVAAGDGYDSAYYTAEGIRRIRRTFRRLFQSLFAHDIFVVAGGTHLHTCAKTDRYTYAALRHLVIYALARLLGLKVWLVGVGVGPFETRTGCLFSRLAVRMAHFVSVRDQQSNQWLERFGIPARRIGRCQDPACYLSLPAQDCDVPHLGISIMSYFRLYSATAERDSDLVNRFHDVIKDWFRVFPDSTVSLVAFYSSGNAESDVVFARTIKAMWANDSRVHVVDPRGCADACIERFRYFTHFISMRYHSQVLASLYGIPQVVLAYHGKNYSFAMSSGMHPGDVVGIEEFAIGGGSAAIGRLFNDRIKAHPMSVNGTLDELLPPEQVWLA